jgi:hypothetical protein
MEQLVERLQIARVAGGQPAEDDRLAWIWHRRSLAPAWRAGPRGEVVAQWQAQRRHHWSARLWRMGRTTPPVGTYHLGHDMAA